MAEITYPLHFGGWQAPATAALMVTFFDDRTGVEVKVMYPDPEPEYIELTVNYAGIQVDDTVVRVTPPTNSMAFTPRFVVRRKNPNWSP